MVSTILQYACCSLWNTLYKIENKCVYSSLSLANQTYPVIELNITGRLPSNNLRINPYAKFEAKFDLQTRVFDFQTRVFMSRAHDSRENSTGIAACCFWPDDRRRSKWERLRRVGERILIYIFFKALFLLHNVIQTYVFNVWFCNTLFCFWPSF